MVDSKNHVGEHKEKTVNMISVELITISSYSSDISYGSVGWVSPKQVKHTTDFVKSSISKYENLNFEQLINISKTYLTSHFTRDENITEILDGNSEIIYILKDI